MRGFGAGLGLVAIAFISFKLGAAGAAVQGTPDPAASPEFYTTKVKPVFDANCARCHMNGNHRGGLNMETREGMLKGGHDGAVLVPGDADKSLIVRLMRHEGPKDDPMNMPPNKPKLSDADIAIVAQWVKAGGVMPAAAATAQ